MQDTVHKVLQWVQLMSCTNPLGPTVYELVSYVQLPERVIREALSELVDQGRVYSTLDDNQYAVFPERRAAPPRREHCKEDATSDSEDEYLCTHIKPPSVTV